MKVKITKDVEAFAKSNKMELFPLEEGVVYISYKRGICGEDYWTAQIVSLLKRDNPSLMVTAIAPFITSVSNLGAIVNFEEKR